jgi:hypothetical protein
MEWVKARVVQELKLAYHGMMMQGITLTLGLEVPRDERAKSSPLLPEASSS